MRRECLSNILNKDKCRRERDNMKEQRTKKTRSKIFFDEVCEEHE